MRYGPRSLSEAEITEFIPRNVLQLVIHNSATKRLSSLLLDAVCLKTCDIRRYWEMECIMESEEKILSQLERMILSDLPELKMICVKVVKPHTLINLKIIHVDSCDSLRCLFTMQLILELKSLEEIAIAYCDRMEEIVEGESNTNTEDSSHEIKVMLPKLQRLKLIDLLYLKSIYNNGDIQCDSLRTIEVIGCNVLNKLPLGRFGIEAGEQMSPSTTLEQITCDEQWWKSLQWDQPQAELLLQPYLVLHRWGRFASSSSSTARGQYLNGAAIT